MNWFTRMAIESAPLLKKQRLSEEDYRCEHVESDVNLAVVIRRENDSFGPVCSSVLCQDCEDKAIQAEDEETHVCVDCKTSQRFKGGVMWKWFDFYAAQGDEPLFVCSGCRTQPAHLNRKARDRADYEQEMGSDEID